MNTGVNQDLLNRKKHFSSFQIISIGFMGAILVGSLLLMLPISTRGTGGASFWDALFTSTSAVCVTGLVVHDTATYWSEFGQFIILMLIQMGGMGIVTMSVAFAIISGRKITLMQRSTMQEAIGAPKMSGIIRMTGFIIRTTLIIELAGAVIMAPVFCGEFGLIKGIWYAVFHSISAFCNAGFDLMGVREHYSSLTLFAAQPVINIVIMLLIIIGGIGFFTWDDIKNNGIHLKKYRMQSKVILAVTAFLIVVPFLFYFFWEFSQNPWDGLSLGEKILAALFQAVTPRTAGFNTVDLGMFSEPGLLLMIILMLIGGSPGSTAGGIKTTTFAVLLSSAIGVFRRKEDTQFFGRRVMPEAVRNAATILMMYIVLALTGTIAISCMENIPILTALFETGSAIATVGLTLGVTPGLCLASRLILVILMFMGRVGGLTLVFAAISGYNKNVSKLPQEKITVG